MQFKFLTAFLLVSVCFSQLLTPVHTQLISVTVSVKIGQAQNAIEILGNILNAKCQDSLKEIEKYKNQVKQQGQEAIEGAKSKFNVTINDCHQQIEEIKKKAETNGTDISECLVNVDSNLKQVFDNTTKGVSQCVTKEIDEAFNIINGAIEMINNSSNDAADLSRKLKACGHSLTSLPCINGVIAEATTHQITLPAKIAKKVLEIGTFVGGLKVRLELCVATQIAKGAVSTTKIIADVTKCGANLTQINIGNLISKIGTNIEILKNITQEKTQGYLKDLKQLINNCTSQGQEAIEGAKSKLNQIIADAKKKIEEIKKNAEGNGTDTSKCFDNVDNSFKQVLDNFLKYEIQCVTKEINEAINIINGTVQIINNFSKDVPELSVQLKACGSNILCINDLNLKVTNLMTLPVKITQKVAEATVFVVGLKFRLELCAATQIVKGAFNATTNIVAEVAKCVVSITPIIQDNVGSWIIKAKTAIEKFKNNTQEKIQNHLKDLEQLINNCTLQGQEAIEGAKSKLNQIIADAKKQIEEIKKKATANGTDISECLFNIDTSFKEVLDNFLKNEIQCVTKEINGALNIIHGAIQFINNVKDVSELSVQLHACGNNISCIKDVNINITNSVITIPAQIAQKVAEVTVFVGGLKFRLELCAVAQIVKGASDATTRIVADVAKCAASIIPLNQVNVSDLIEQGKLAIEKLQNSTVGPFQNYLDLLQKFKDFCKSQAQEAIDGAKSELNLTIANGHKQIEEIKKVAEKNGAVISECLVNVSASVKQVSENLLQNGIHCVTKEIDEALHTTNTTIQVINDSSKKIADLPGKLKACGTSLICIKSVIAEVAICENIPVKIAWQVLEATVFLGGLKFRLELCAVAQIGKAGVSAMSEIVTNVSKCSIGILVKGNKCL